MSSPAAIAAISAILCNLLSEQMSTYLLPTLTKDVVVSAVAPDLINVTADASPQVNLFLYRVSPNQGWWNVGQPSRAADGSLVCTPPLALNLHYLLTAYGQTDYQAELMLGYAMQLLHDQPAFDQTALQKALGNLPPAFAALDVSDLAYQPESITITLEPSNTEEIARLWTAIQSNYRPTATYVVTVVLIHTPTSQVSALPVLSRGAVNPATGRDTGPVVTPSMAPPQPTLTGVGVQAGQTAAQLGQSITLLGSNLSGSNPVLTFSHPLLSASLTLTGTPVDAQTVTATLPTAAAAAATWPAGTYSVTLTVQPPGDDQARTTNAVTLVLAPTLTLPPSSITRDPTTGAVSLTLQVQPSVLAGQDVWLFLGSAGAPAQSPATGETLQFVLSAVPAGAQWVRLRVDGAETRLVDTSTSPPSFVASQTVTVP